MGDFQEINNQKTKNHENQDLSFNVFFRIPASLKQLRKQIRKING